MADWHEGYLAEWRGLFASAQEQEWIGMTHGACLKGHQPWRSIVEQRRAPIAWHARAYFVLLAPELSSAPFPLDRARMPQRYVSQTPIISLTREPETAVLQFVAALVHAADVGLDAIEMSEEERLRARRCYNTAVRPDLLALHVDVERVYADFAPWEARDAPEARLDGLRALLWSGAGGMWKQRADRRVRQWIARQPREEAAPHPAFVQYVAMLGHFLDQLVDDWQSSLPYGLPLLIDQLQFVASMLRRTRWRPTWHATTFEHTLAYLTMARRKDLAALFVGDSIQYASGAELVIDAASLDYLLRNLEQEWRVLHVNAATVRALEAGLPKRKTS